MRSRRTRINRCEERFHSLVAATAEVVWTTDTQGNVTEDAPTWRAFTGQTQEEVQGQGWINALHPEDRERTAVVWSRAVKTHAHYDTEYRVRRYDGEYRHVTVRGVPVFSRDGSIREWVGICTDITDRKRAAGAVEEELHWKTALLEAQVHSSIDGILVVDSRGKKVLQNQRMTELWEIPPYVTNDQDDKAQLRYVVNQTKHPEQFIEKVNFLYSHPNEISRDEIELNNGMVLDRYSSPVFDKSGKYYGRIWTFRDITERKQAEEVLKRDRDHLEELVKARTAELIEAKERTEEVLRRDRDYLEELVRARTAELVVAKERAEVANEAKSAFLARMSHELRTPLNAILGYAQIFQRRPLDSEVRQGLQSIQQSGEHLLTLINDILNLSRIEAGKMELHPTLISFPTFLEGIAGIIRSRAEAKNLSFIFETPATLPAGVEADQTRLRQILLNLLDNAVKFTDAGSITLRVLRLNARAPALLRFEVEDTGIGIASGELERIFLPFEQSSRATRWSEGTGLGLAISRQLVQLMGGRLQVESELGHGSRFWFDVALPAKEAAAEAVLPHRLIAGYRGPRRRVLVADDIASNRDVMVEFLQAVGLEVVQAADGQEAIGLAQEMRPDLILLDLHMPVLDGIETALRLRQIPELRKVVIIAVSASVSEEDQSQSRQAGCDAFLAKPVRWPRLSALLEQHLKLEWELSEPVSDVIHSTAEETEQLAPPREELKVLLDLARMGDLSAIQARAAQIHALGLEYVPFADRLSGLARGFEEKEILDWIQRCLEDKQ